MKCCPNCYTSPFLKNIISRSEDVGACDFCGSNGVRLVDARELSVTFGLLLDIYGLADEGPSLVPQLAADFPNLVFASEDDEIATGYLRAIFEDDLETYGSYLEQPVRLLALQDANRQEELNTLQLTWDEFVKEIKYTNRFHLSSVLDLAKLEKLFRTISVSIPAGKILYRGRISSSAGFPDNEMWNPPRDKTPAGRANPLGISYLYLANDLETTLAETRASVHDYVSVAQFRVREPLNIVDLKVIGSLDPFELADKEQLDDYVSFLPFLKNLRSELSKPNRRTDSELDYIPTQYVTEFIKSIGFDGVGYGSSMKTTGHNFAFFETSRFEFLRNEIYEITGTEYVNRLVRRRGEQSVV